MDLARVADRLLAHALGFPEAWEDHPWGERVAKVGKKVFLFFGHEHRRGDQLTLAVKLPVSGTSALDRAECEATGYGLGRHGWVTAKFERGDVPPIEVLESWIEESYRAVAPKKLVKLLDAGSPPAEGRSKPAVARPTRGQKATAAAKRPSPRARQSTSRDQGSGRSRSSKLRGA